MRTQSARGECVVDVFVVHVDALVCDGAGGTGWYNILTSYTSTAGVPIPNSVVYKASTSVSYTYGTALTDSNIASIVSTAITSHALPLDANGIYFVLTSPDVTATSGFCSAYCGWHTYGTLSGVAVKYAFVGNAASLCPGSCGVQASGPNGNAVSGWWHG